MLSFAAGPNLDNMIKRNIPSHEYVEAAMSSIIMTVKYEFSLNWWNNAKSSAAQRLHKPEMCKVELLMATCGYLYLN